MHFVARLLQIEVCLWRCKGRIPKQNDMSNAHITRHFLRSLALAPPPSGTLKTLERLYTTSSYLTACQRMPAT